MKFPLQSPRAFLTRPTSDSSAPAFQSVAAPPALSILDLPAPLQDDIHFLSTLCTRLWRFERQLQKVADDEPSESHNRLQRRFESITEALREAKIEIIDHDGEKYDAGMTLTVLQWEPREELNREMIIETVKPTLRLRGMLLAGEVIVGQPVAVEAQPVAVEAQPVAVEAQPGVPEALPVADEANAVADEVEPSVSEAQKSEEEPK